MSYYCLPFINNLSNNKFFFKKPYVYWQKAVYGLYLPKNGAVFRL